MFIQEGKLTSLTNKTTCHEKGKSCGYPYIKQNSPLKCLNIYKIYKHEIKIVMLIISF